MVTTLLTRGFSEPAIWKKSNRAVSSALASRDETYRLRTAH
jgi:hypothetical protein